MEKKQEEKNTEKVKKRTSLKNIIGGDILATRSEEHTSELQSQR